MARSLRIEFPGALYHITSRGDGQENIFLSDEDRAIFLGIFSEVCWRCNWICYSYCLMSNHYHLLVETPEGNLSKGMQLLNGIYTQKFNRLHRRVGHVFQGRFKGILVEKDNYLLELSRYIVLNPVRAKMVSIVSDWVWSSYHATLQLNLRPTWLSTDYILSLFSENMFLAIQKYQEFVEEGVVKNSPWNHLKNQIYLGSDDFVQQMLDKVEPEKNLLGIPKIQYTPDNCTIQEFEEISSNRNDGIRLAYKSGQFTLGEIGNYFGLHYSSVSRIVNSW